VKPVDTLTTQSVLRRLMILYVTMAVLVAIGMILSNVFISRYAWQRVVLSAGEVGIFYSGLVLLLRFVTRRALETGNAQASKLSPVDKQNIWSKVISLPQNVFMLITAAGIMVPQLLMLIELPLIGVIPDLSADWNAYMKRTIFTTSTFIGVAAIHYTMVLWIVRTFIRGLSVTRVEEYRFQSIARPLLTIFCLTILFPVLRMLWYAMDSSRTGAELHGAVIVMLAAITLAFGFTTFVLLVLSLYRDVNRVTERVRELIAFKRNGLPHRISLVSGYESGEVVSAFNRLQDRFEEHYSQMNRELEMASQVQSRLLADQAVVLNDWTFLGNREHDMELGGGFYDSMPLESGRVALLAGYVSGTGLPSALIMSSVLALFRTHARAASDPAGVIAAIQASLAGLLTDELALHIGCGVLHTEEGSMEFAGSESLQCSTFSLREGFMLVLHNYPLTGPSEELEPRDLDGLNRWLWGCAGKHRAGQHDLVYMAAVRGGRRS
jgi:hypothetical protein